MKPENNHCFEMNFCNAAAFQKFLKLGLLDIWLYLHYQDNIFGFKKIFWKKKK